MKQHFSTQWNASVQPRKQRKYLANAPIHIRHQILSANLSKELRKKYGKRSFPVRKGDEIKIMVGEFKKKTGKIDLIDIKNYRVTIEGIQRTKKDGTKIKVFFHPSNLQIKELNLDDKNRKQALERKLIAKKQVVQKTESVKPKAQIKQTKPMQSSSSKNEEPTTQTKTKIKPTQSSVKKTELATSKNAPKKK